MINLFDLSNSKETSQDSFGKNLLILEEILKERVEEVKELNSQTFFDCKKNIFLTIIDSI